MLRDSGLFTTPVICCSGQDYSFLEFFAGTGNLHRVFRAVGRLKAARFGIKDANMKPHRRSHYMDLNSESGFWLLVPIDLPSSTYRILVLSQPTKFGDTLHSEAEAWPWLCSLWDEMLFPLWYEQRDERALGLCCHWC